MGTSKSRLKGRWSYHENGYELFIAKLTARALHVITFVNFLVFYVIVNRSVVILKYEILKMFNIKTQYSAVVHALLRVNLDDGCCL